MDESGTPGIANGSDDYLVVSVVFFDDRKQVDRVSEAIVQLRRKQRLPEHYEFHFARNNPKNQQVFIGLMRKLKLQFITVAIRKTGERRQASFAHVAELLAPVLAQYGEKTSILMDNNPTLHRRLKQECKKWPHMEITLRQCGAHSDDLVQLADYIAAICARSLRNPDKLTIDMRMVLDRREAFIVV